MEKIYIGNKKKGDRGTSSSNYGNVYIRQENGLYICENMPGCIFTEDQIRHDLSLGYLKTLD